MEMGKNIVSIFDSLSWWIIVSEFCKIASMAEPKASFHVKKWNLDVTEERY